MVRPFSVTEPPKPIKRNRLGFHLLPIGVPADFLPMLKRLHAAGKPMPVINMLFVGGSAAFSCATLKQASPRTTVIARIFQSGDYHAEDFGANGWDKVTRQDGRNYFERNRHFITEDMFASADYIQIRDFNEPGEGTKINDWMHGLLDGADAMGVRLALCNFSVGNPGLPGDARPYADYWTWQSTHDLLRRIKRDKHAFCIHTYAFNDQWRDEDTILRQRKIYKWLPADLQDLKLWRNEDGESYSTFPPPDRSPMRYNQRMRTLQDDLRNSPGDGDGTLWTLGDTHHNPNEEGSWARDNLAGILPVYEQMAME